MCNVKMLSSTTRPIIYRLMIYLHKVFCWIILLAKFYWSLLKFELSGKIHYANIELAVSLFTILLFNTSAPRKRWLTANNMGNYKLPSKTISFSVFSFFDNKGMVDEDFKVSNFSLPVFSLNYTTYINRCIHVKNSELKKLFQIKAFGRLVQ